MTQHSNFPHKAAGHKPTRWDSTTVDSASHPAARHKPVASSRGEAPVPAACSVSNASTSTAALRLKHLNYCIFSSAVNRSAAKNRSWKRSLIRRCLSTELNALSPPCLSYTIKEQSPWSIVLLEKLVVSQLVKKFPTFYETQRFIGEFTRVSQFSFIMSQINPVKAP
jgi:hypothetical protein